MLLQCYSPFLVRWKVWSSWTSQECENAGLERSQQGNWYLKYFSLQSPKIRYFMDFSLPVLSLASLISSWSLGWVSPLEPDFSGGLKILFSFPSLFAISCGNSCWHNSEQYPGRGRDWTWARSYTSRDARGGNQFARSCLWLPSCHSLPEYSPGTDNFRTHWKYQVCLQLCLYLCGNFYILKKTYLKM